MITKLAVVSVMVLDQDAALDFYSNKLGLEVAQDARKGPFRYLTVRVPTDPGTEIFLELPGPPVQDEATAAQLRELLPKGALRVVFYSDDVRALYEALKARGVTEFTQEPMDHPYGTDIRLHDPFGNAIRILQLTIRRDVTT